MESSGSDEDRLQQQGEAAFAKKMKILIIMLSLVLMILLLPLATHHGLPLLKPMGVSMLQRLWDAMRFIAMTAAISIGIISTSNSHKHIRNFDGSSHSRSSLGSRRPSTALGTSSSSNREAFNPGSSNIINRNRSGPFSPQLRHTIPGEDEGDDYQSRGMQMDNMQGIKGKEVVNDLPSSPSAYSETYFDSSGVVGHGPRDTGPRFVQSDRESIEAPDYDGYRDPPLKLSMVNSSRRQWSAGDLWFLASTIDEEVEEEPMASTGYGIAPSRFQAERNMSRIDLQKKALDSGKEAKEMKSPEKGLTNVYNSLTDDNYAELRLRKSALSRLADEYHDGKGKVHRRSSSVDRRRPVYVYDQPSPDQPGLKQILMEISKERPSKFKMSDSESSRNQAYDAKQRGLGRSTHGQVQSSSNSNASTSASSVQQSLKANVQHRQASVDSTVKMPSHLAAISKKADAEIMGMNHVVHHKKGQAIQMDTNKVLQKEADTGVMGPDPLDQSRQENGQKQVNAKLGFDQNLQPKQAGHFKVSSGHSAQKSADGGKVGTQQNVNRGGDSKAHMGSKQGDVKIGLTKTLEKFNAKDYDPMQSFNELGFEGANIQNQNMHARGPGEDRKTVSQKTNRSSASKLLKQSSKHSQSALNLAQLEQTGPSTQPNAWPPAGPSARGRRSFSYDFGDGFNPDWLLELEPPPPPGLFSDQGSSAEAVEQSRSNFEVKDTHTSSVVQSLVPWRSTAPIDISAYPRAASPLEMLSQISGPSPGEVNRRADEFISNFTTRLIKQRQESLERTRRYVG